MKIYEKIVIDIESGKTLLEVSYKYSGEVAKCKGGGGGGNSGKVDYPDYMKTQHETWLTAIATDITTARSGNSPYYSAAAYDPTTPLAAMDTAVCAFNTVVDALSNESDWDSAMTQAKTTIDALISDTYINADVDAFAGKLDDQVDNITIPKFQRGMQDINAVQSSAFVLGEALIYGMRDRDVAKYTSDLRLKSSLMREELIVKSASEMLQALLTRVDFEKNVAHYTLEYNRMYIAAKKDWTDQDYEYDELDAKWDLEMFQYGGNVMASIAGAATNQGTKGPSKAASALGGAMSGAAAGLATSFTPMGAAIGGALGLASSFL